MEIHSAISELTDTNSPVLSQRMQSELYLQVSCHMLTRTKSVVSFSHTAATCEVSDSQKSEVS